MQLRDLTVKDRILALNIKADMITNNIKTNDYNTSIKGMRALLKAEPDFFLINEEFIEAALSISLVYNDTLSIKKLKKLRKLSSLEIEKRARRFLEKEYLKREYIFSYEEYQEMLELDDALIKEKTITLF